MTTIIEWYDATKARPAKSGDVLINASGDYVQTVNYSKKHDLFNAHDGDTRERAEDYAIYPKRWAHTIRFPDVSDTVREVLNNG